VRPSRHGIDGLADPATRAVQQHTLVIGSDAEQSACLLSFAALDVTQDDDGALSSRQAVDRLHRVIPQLSAGDDSLRVDLVPQAGRLDPVAIRLEFRRARFSTMLNTQGTTLERRPIPENTASQASCTTSSAWARLPMIEAPRPINELWKRLISRR
jgi:hypothetical protein